MKKSNGAASRVRLDKYVASVSDYSRTEVKRLLKQSHIRVNGETTKDPAQHVCSATDTVTLYDEPLALLAPRYFMLNKPQQTICATEDSMHPTVIDLINEPNSEQLHIAGRLDKDTTGLVLITDDGQWSHRITSPNHDCIKTYRVSISESLSDTAKKQLAQGVQLHNEDKPTRPATVITIDTTTIKLSISEGKYHQVKRMLAAVGNHVEQLHRISIGDITLDTELEEGEYRALTKEEVMTVSL
ncbi:16S rRNA pseudouridine(516) synthase RsuA [Eionea flava]